MQAGLTHWRELCHSMAYTVPSLHLQHVVSAAWNRQDHFTSSCTLCCAHSADMIRAERPNPLGQAVSAQYPKSVLLKSLPVHLLTRTCMCTGHLSKSHAGFNH